ncbi:MAG: hypothetical protein JRD89_16885, partial [Deltaproteobacteria bacterium]|nr:hypothetical protein [Deltaproteobacteria bacterium]
MRVQVIGCGVVGEAVALAAEERGHTVSRFDPLKGLREFDAEAALALISVGTPLGPGGVCNTSAVDEAVAELVRQDFYGVVAIRSTVPPGTNARIREDQHWRFSTCAWPEFLRAATAREQSAKPAYHVWGIDPIERTTVLPVLHEFIEGGAEAPVWLLTPTEAEFLKYASNVMIAGQI